jgi:hypothetical protein
VYDLFCVLIQPNSSSHADDTVMTEDVAESHRSMLLTKVDNVLKESMEMSHFKQHLQNPLYGLQSSVSSSHSAFATRMADAVAAAAGVPLIQVFGPTMPLIAWKLSMTLKSVLYNSHNVLQLVRRLLQSRRTTSHKAARACLAA